MSPRLALVALLLAAPLAAQDLDRADRLAREGRLDEARGEVMAWWSGPGADRPAREEVQHALWLRGLLTLDPSQAMLDYTRLVVEHPVGEFTARALLRLARIAEARGDEAVARRHFEVLRRDHPRSPHVAEAAAWLEAHPAPEESAARATPPPADPASRGDWAVQLGAFSQPPRAADLAQRARERGFDTRVVTTPGTDLMRVRVGRFTARDGASALQERLRALGFDALVVDDASEERAAGG